VADALGLVANDAARRGALRSAISTAERAAEFDESQEHRVEHLLAALGWALDADDNLAVIRVGAALRATTVDVDGAIALALAEADAFMRGEPLADAVDASGSGWDGARSRWVRRRDRRRSIAAALDRGDHAQALELISQVGAAVPGTEAPPPGDRVNTAIAIRHRGDVREARSALLATSAGAALTDPEHVVAPGSPIGNWTALLVAADLNILAGRGDDAIRSLALNASHLPATLTDWSMALAARAALQSEPACEPRSHPDAFIPFGSGPLLEIRVLIATGALLGDLDALDRAIALADDERLPIEGGEARLWALPLRDVGSQPRERSAASGALQRCGVRGWDRRIEHLAAATSNSSGSAAGPKPVDPEVEALSAAERRVADAVASGMTNRETAALLIVSVKTVDFHLQQIYRKLGIRSRTELAIRMMQGLGND
jgi:DNA-binding CsgD family transcriptional regulator